ncbi:MAG: hypothetical protein KAT58_01295 [candidate division Zixibacteria bacterium]|nr:hypothetical protein [candidate division Zixibacteria bacterium]
MVLLLVILYGTLAADKTLVSQQAVGGNTGIEVKGVASPFSLFDRTRFQMNHGYSISYFSAGGEGNMIAMYLNQIDYDLTRTLRLSVRLSWLHQPQAALGISKRTISNQLLPAFRLDWRPSDKFHLQINYETLSPYSYYHRRSGFYDNSLWGGETKVAPERRGQK